MIGAVSSQSNLSSLIALRRQQSDDASTSDASGAATEARSARRHHHHGGPPPEAMEAAAKVLGMSTSDLQSALRSGTKLKDLAASKGVSEADLVDAVKQGLAAGPSRGADGVSNAPKLTDAQLTEIATSIVNGERPPRPPAGAGGPDADLAALSARTAGATSGATTSTGVSITGATDAYRTCEAMGTAASTSSTAAADGSVSGIDVTSLLEQLRNGTSFADIASSSNMSTQQLANVLVKGLLTDRVA